VQAGVNSAYDRHIQRLDKLSKHFSKNKGGQTETSFDFDKEFELSADDPDDSVSTGTKRRY
jgi:hypothetical protein